jgi:integrase
MPRKRSNPADNWLPPRVYRGRSRYEYRPLRADVVLLCFLPKDKIESAAVKVQVWDDYKKAIAAPVARRDIAALMAAYFLSPQFARKSANTKIDYKVYSRRIGRVFGHMLPNELKSPHIRQFMDALEAQGKIVTANRHHSFLSIILGWGLERGWCNSNPAKDVKKFEEEPRDRYIEDWEYNLVYAIAIASAYPYIAPMMEFAYMMRARSIELLNLTENDVLEGGLYLKRRKKSNSEITGWSDRLIAALNDARALFPDAPVNIKRPIFHGKSGCPIPRSAFKTAWRRIINQALKSGLIEIFTFHDIKAKGVTDHDTKESGHRTKKGHKIYDRKPGIIAPTR